MSSELLPHTFWTRVRTVLNWLNLSTLLGLLRRQDRRRDDHPPRPRDVPRDRLPLQLPGRQRVHGRQRHRQQARPRVLHGPPGPAQARGPALHAVRVGLRRRDAAVLLLLRRPLVRDRRRPLVVQPLRAARQPRRRQLPAADDPSHEAAQEGQLSARSETGHLGIRTEWTHRETRPYAEATHQEGYRDTARRHPSNQFKMNQVLNPSR